MKDPKRLPLALGYIGLLTLAPLIELWAISGSFPLYLNYLPSVLCFLIAGSIVGYGYLKGWNWTPWFHLLIWVTYTPTAYFNTMYLVQTSPNTNTLALATNILLAYLLPFLMQMYLFRSCKEKFVWYDKDQALSATLFKLLFATVVVVGALSIFIGNVYLAVASK